ncbi:hypothetical protein GCM10010964_31290 [Caldovatus sediminis]|uniref:FAS1 domain-containing protein n=1 Tax=Caldovatus sediminis TaxID=2041189 RepID=A0A8J2ZDE0_9PROT|nr:fasciclin domain-containing protein [Caldovatus sediminis]GGG41501.1 hypothetical protein GCM10010964_31290 [Caldovatus sediminis]
MAFWHRRRLLAAAAAGVGGATLLTGGGRAGRAQTVVAPPGSTVVITPPPAAASATGRNVADTLAADGRFGRFLDLLSRAGMVEELRGAGPFTVLAPTDAAVQGAPSAMLQDLVGTPGSGDSAGGGDRDPVRLRALVQYHVIPGLPYGAALPAAGEHRLRTLNGNEVHVRSSGGEDVAVSNPAPGLQSAGFGAAGANVMPAARLAGPAIPASNGVIWPLTGVLFP